MRRDDTNEVLRHDYDDVIVAEMRRREWAPGDLARAVDLPADRAAEMMAGTYRPREQVGRRVERALGVRLYIPEAEARTHTEDGRSAPGSRTDWNMFGGGRR